MTEPIIRVENLSKSYVLKHQQRESYVALRDVISQKAKNMFAGKSQSAIPTSELFYALRDVNFEVNQGDRIGIIGRNGAGKSTLLKILSRITEPTSGTITIDGRVASLLEVGTGFHPELTGRENIFLNGAILGMSKAEIKSKFDEIVTFADVEKFLDTPVKRYSSGMYVRLAFAVAAHLEPEILIVDEVLAVGDAQFQKKCLGKMKDVSSSGRTILFVSHSISAIRSLCNKAILLVGGEVEKFDEVEAVIPSYLGILKDGKANGIRVEALPLSPTGEWHIGTDIAITISWEKYRMVAGWQCDIACYTVDGSKIFALESEKFSEFSSDNPEFNGVTFNVRNIGFINSNIRLDIGLKQKKGDSYFIVIENCMMLSPSDKSLPDYKNVIVVPPSTCKAQII